MFIGEENGVLSTILWNLHDKTPAKYCTQAGLTTRALMNDYVWRTYLATLIGRFVSPRGTESEEEYEKAMKQSFKKSAPFWTALKANLTMQEWVCIDEMIDKMGGGRIELPKALLEYVSQPNTVAHFEELAGWLSEEFILSNQLFAYYALDKETGAKVFNGYVTSNMDIVSAMINAGLIKDGASIATRLAGVFIVSKQIGLPTKFVSCFSKHTHCVVKLVPLPRVNGQPQFECVVPQSGVIYSPLILVSVLSEIYTATAMQVNLASMPYCTVSWQSGTERKKACITLNKEAYLAQYEKLDKAKAYERSKKQLGYSLYPHGVTLLNMESSIYSERGTVRISDISTVKLEKTEPLDTSLLGINPTAVKQFFIKKVNAMSTVNALFLQDRGFCPSCTFESKADICTKAGDMHYSELYRFMKSNPDIFGVVDRGLKAIKTVEMHTITLPTDVEARRAVLEDLLAKQIVCIYASTRNGTRQLFATNNETLLEEKLGTDYRGKYESFDNKIAYLKKWCFTGKTKTRSALIKTIADWNIPYIDGNDLVSMTPDAFDVMIELGKQRKPNRKYTPNPANITLRCVDITDPKDYFKSVGLANIERVEI